MNEQKAQYINGYWRNKDDQQNKTDEGSIIIAAVMFTSILVMLAIVFWQTTLVLIAAGLITAAAHIRYKRHQELMRNGLVVNTLGKRRMV